MKERSQGGRAERKKSWRRERKPKKGSMGDRKDRMKRWKGEKEEEKTVRIE